jgi:hypothetical protein
LFPVRESLVSDIPAGDGKSITFFYSAGERITPSTQSMFIESSNLGIERKQKGLGYEKM